MWARFVSFVRTALGRNRFEAEMDEELRFHIERHADDLEHAGMPRPEALRQARLQFGPVPTVKDDIRRPRGLVLLEHLSQDVRRAVRTLGTPTSWAAVAILAVAIGLTTATFSIFDALFLRPVPFPNHDRLAYLNLGDQNGSRPPAWNVSRAWRESDIFEAAGAWWGSWSVVVETDSGPTVRASTYVTPGTLEVLGVRPLHGRTFGPHDAQSGEAVVISEGLWTSGFGRNAAVIGRSIEVDGVSAVVIGVLPQSFRFPDYDIELWRPLAESTAGVGSWDRPVTLVRFRGEVPTDDTLRLATEIAHQTDSTTAGTAAVPERLAGWPSGSYAEQALPLIAGGVSLMFLALCANVAGLLLARFNQRRRQFALCAALGASRRRLIAQAFTEAAVLGTLGSVAGSVLAHQLLAAARALIPRDFFEWSLHPVLLDRDTLFVAVGVASVATIVSGLLPAIVATRLNGQSSARLVERSGTETWSARVLSRAFVVVEVALACALLVPALLLSRSLVNLTSIDRGVNPERLSIVQVNFDNAFAPDAQRRIAVATQASDLLRGLPGVEQLTWSTGVPTMENGIHFGRWQPDTPGSAPVQLTARGISVGSDFFSIFGVPLIAGRGFSTGDDDGRVVLDQRIAAALWPGVSAVGRSFTWGKRRLEVVGVARSVRRQTQRDPPTLYWKFEPGGRYATIGLRCAVTCPSEAVVRQRLLPIASALRVGGVERLKDRFDQDLAAPRMTSAVTMAFAGIALIAAAVGLFSMLSYAVGRRRREFGIRAALGGSSRAIGGLVLRDAVITAVLGLGLGSAAAWFLARALESIQFGVTINDPVGWVTVIGILAVATFGAAWHPMRAAMRADPALLMREE